MKYTRFRDVSLFAEDRKSSVTEATQYLKSKGVPVVAGLYDSVLLESVTTVPPAADGGLSPRTGLGAVQLLMRPLGIRVTVHDVSRTNQLVLRKGSSNRVVRWQFQAQPKGELSQFRIRRFMAETAHDYYLLTTFVGPTAWVVTRKELLKQQERIDSRGIDKESPFRIPSDPDNLSDLGDLVMRLTPTTAPYHLTSARQLGL